MANQTYGGRYAVIERVGVGGMAEVYRARDELLGRDVAVKVLNERLSADKTFVERFRREAQAAASLSHPNIVSLYDYGTDGTTNFIVMEFIDGRSVAEVIAAEGALLPERAAEIAADVAKALERAHTAGMVHRDVKSNNIMLTSTGQTKVTDFGIVRALGGDAEHQMTQTGMVIGTAAYLSPEQAQGNPVDARSDVYSLGVVLYEMLTGRPPFTGDTPLAVAYKHVREDPVPPSSINPDVPHDLDAVALKAMAKNPDNRYSSAAEMREDLERYIAGHKVHATPLLGAETMVATQVGGGTQVMRGTEVYPDRPPERSRGLWYVVIALLILGLFALVAWFVATHLLDSGKLVTVKDVVGLERADAETILGDQGFKVDVQEKASDKPIGIVVKQDPKAKRKLEEGQTVTIFVSSGARQVDVPDVVGQDIADARTVIKDAELVPVVTRQADETVPADEVISQNPSGGDQADAGSDVELVVSSGPEAVIVPDVINQSQGSAEAEIGRVNLVAEVQTAPSDDVEKGFVISQDPDPGTEAQPGDTVRILVSEGPEQRAMPDVRGQDADQAQQMLEDDYGLVVSQQEETCTNATPPGFVCDQDPSPGTPVSSGDSATLFVQPGTASTGNFARMFA